MITHIKHILAIYFITIFLRILSLFAIYLVDNILNDDILISRYKQRDSGAAIWRLFMTPQPCKGCRFGGAMCEMAGLVNRLAVEHWLKDVPFGCADYTEDSYHGLEGVFA
jgi:hypothetical protein